MFFARAWFNVILSEYEDPSVAVRDNAYVNPVGDQYHNSREELMY